MKDIISNPPDYITKEAEYVMMNILAIGITFASIFVIQKEVDDYCFFSPKCCLICLLLSAVVGRVMAKTNKDMLAIGKNLLVGVGLYFSVTYRSVIITSLILLEIALILWIGVVVFDYVFSMLMIYKKRILLSRVPWKKFLKTAWDAEVFLRGLLATIVLLSLLKKFVI